MKLDHQIWLLSNMFNESNDETKFQYNLLLTNEQVSKLCNGSTNNLSNDIKLSKTQLSTIVQSREFLGRILGILLKTGVLLMKNVLRSLVKIVLTPSRLEAAASAADSRIHETILDWGWQY